MSKMGKKRNGWKVAFLALAAVVVVFLIWAFISGDDYDDDYYDEPRKEGTQLSDTVGGYTADNNSQFLESDAVKEHKVNLVGGGNDTVTILVYMNGSDLESEDSEATNDLTEMVNAGSSDKVNIIVQTMGTKKWNKKYGISSSTAQRYKVDGSGLTLLEDNLGNLSCTESSTLRDFIRWGSSMFPADRYILQFWNHGGGPVYGFGYDDKTESEDYLGIDEIQKALGESGVYFDFIGMDCCLMSCMEVCCAFYDFCDYMILSEDFESGLGWEYTNWLSKLYENTSISTRELGKIICDDMVNANATNTDGWGDDSIMALVDMSMMKVLYQTWTDFAYSNEASLLDSNYSRKRTRSRNGRVHPAIAAASQPNSRGFFSSWFGDEDDEEDPLMSDYFVTDIMALASTISSTESKALASAVNNTLVYVKACGEDTSLTGISVTLPYGDSDFYNSLKSVFKNCGFDDNYISWLGNFVSASGSNDYYDYDDWDDSWDGWDDYEDDFDWDEWCDECEYDDDYWDDDDSWGWLFYEFLEDWIDY